MVLFKNRFFQAYGLWHWGEGLQTVLLTWYMTFHAELTATQIGFYQALVLSPFLIFTISGGALSDRIGAGISYVISTSLFAVILVSYGILEHEFGFVPKLFFLYCVLSGVASAVSNPAIDTFIPDATSLRVQKNALLSATAHNIAKLIGTLTGLLLPILTATGGFIANGVLMFLSVVFLTAHKRKKPQTPSGPSQIIGTEPNMLRQVFAHYRANPESFDILLSNTLIGLVMVPAGYILFPLILREKFPEFGNLFALLGISSWTGAIIATSVAKQMSDKIVKPGVVSLVIWGAYGLGLLVLTVVGNFYALCAAVFVFGGVMLGKAMVYGNYLNNCPKGQRGLLIAIYQTAFWGLATLGTVAMGFLVDTLGLDSTIIATSGFILLGVIGLTLRGQFIAMKQPE